MILKLVQGTTTITLSGDGATLAGGTYVPRTASLPADFDYSDYEALYALSVTESATVVLTGTAAAILAQVRTLEALFPAGNRLRRVSPESRLFVAYQAEGGTALYRAEILAGRVEFPEEALTPRLLSGSVEILVAWTRRGVWEAASETELGLYSIGTASKQTGGSTVTNSGGLGLFIDGADVDGVVPTPLRLELTNNNGVSVSFRRFFLSLNAFADPQSQRDDDYHIIEGEDATSVSAGGSTVALATCRGGNYKLMTWATTAAHNANYFNFTLPAAALASMAGGWFRLLVRLVVAPPVDTFVKLAIKIPAGAAPLTTIWESGEMRLDTLYSLRDLGTIPLPPLALASHDDVALILSVRRAGAGSLGIDFLALLSTDAMHAFEQTGYQIPNGHKVILDGIARRTVYYQSTTGKQLGIYRDNLPHLHLWPGRDQAVEILYDEGSSMTVSRTLSVRAYTRPRRLTV